MATPAIEMSLDDIISSKPKRRPGRGTRRVSGARGATTGNVNATVGSTARARYSGSVPASNNAVQAAINGATTNQPDSTKIIVSNLPPDVNEPQIKELFTSTVGPLKEVNLHHDAHGKSKGVAHVIFVRKGDGTKAFSQYNNRLIDGKRPMKIEIVLEPAPPPTLAQRVAPAPKATPIAANTGASAAPKRTGGGGGRGRGGRGRGGKRRGERPAKSVADLDAEMEDYSANPAAPGDAAAAPAA